MAAWSSSGNYEKITRKPRGESDKRKETDKKRTTQRSTARKGKSWERSVN